MPCSCKSRTMHPHSIPWLKQCCMDTDFKSSSAGMLCPRHGTSGDEQYRALAWRLLAAGPCCGAGLSSATGASCEVLRLALVLPLGAWLSVLRLRDCLSARFWASKSKSGTPLCIIMDIFAGDARSDLRERSALLAKCLHLRLKHRRQKLQSLDHHWL